MSFIWTLHTSYHNSHQQKNCLLKIQQRFLLLIRTANQGIQNLYLVFFTFLIITHFRITNQRKRPRMSSATSIQDFHLEHSESSAQSAFQTLFYNWLQKVIHKNEDAIAQIAEGIHTVAVFLVEPLLWDWIIHWWQVCIISQQNLILRRHNKVMSSVLHSHCSITTHLWRPINLVDMTKFVVTIMWHLSGLPFIKWRFCLRALTLSLMLQCVWYTIMTLRLIVLGLSRTPHNTLRAEGETIIGI